MTNIIKRLQSLGRHGWGRKPEWSDAHTYFSHSGGRVSLESATDFYIRAVRLAMDAEAEIVRLNKQIEEAKKLLSPTEDA